MADSPVQRAFNQSRKAQKRLSGVTITLARGLTSSSLIVATVGFSGDQVFTEDGNTFYTRHRDYLIDVSDYDFGSGAVKPQRHDVITEVINGVPTQFEVVNDSSDDVATYDGTVNRTQWRVHTKEI